MRSMLQNRLLACAEAVTAVTGAPGSADPLATMGKNMFDDKAPASVSIFGGQWHLES